MALPDEARLTDERLRTWNLSTASQERMCLLLLATEPEFGELRPRRPEGGPDDGRDIEGVYTNGAVFFGAVGFRGRVSDSPRDKSEIKRKFINDLDAAVSAKNDLTVFVFLTNVDLTDRERDELIETAGSRGIQITQIYHRERLRFILDRDPRGWAIRHKFLEIEMSREEQAAVLDDLFERVERESSRVLEALAYADARESAKFRQLDFVHARLLPTRRLDAVVVFGREIHATELGPFALAFYIQPGPQPHGVERALVMTSRNDYLIDLAGVDDPEAYLAGTEKVEDERILYQSWQRTWVTNPRVEYAERRMLDRASETGVVRSTVIVGPSEPLEPISTIDALHCAHYRLFMTPSIWERCKYFFFLANNYTILWFQHQDLYMRQLSSEEVERIAQESDWPDNVQSTFASLSCLEISVRLDLPSPFKCEPIRGGMQSDFDHYLPPKAPPEMLRDTMVVG
jgi:hypothetical protein